MKVVLRSDIKGIGKRGDIVDVADGHARNFLVPNGQAIPASPGIEQQATSMRRSRDVKDTKERGEAEIVARTLVPAVITIKAKTHGSEGKLFGSVSTTDIAEAVREQTGIDLDRKAIHMDEHIRSVGAHAVQIRLHNDVQFTVNVEVQKA
jgi:large subunit ribosomal protein L9